MKLSVFTLVLFTVFIALGVSPARAQTFTPPYTVGLDVLMDISVFSDEMASLGYVEGENIFYLSVNYENVAFEDMMAARMTQVEAIINNPDLDIFVANNDSDAVLHRERIRADVPIVFLLSDDPVATGAVADLVVPGGSMTGVVTSQPYGRRLQLMVEILPATDKVAYLYNPLTGDAASVLAQTQAIADDLGIELVPMETPDGATAAAALENTPEGIDWFFLTPYVPFFDTAFNQALFTIVGARNIPISYISDNPSYYLMGYGPNFEEAARQAARQVDRILRGADPAQLPLETAENYLMVNVETAAMMGIEIPVGILRQAHVIVRPGDLPSIVPTEEPAG